jgi:hypothetical protein
VIRAQPRDVRDERIYALAEHATASATCTNCRGSVTGVGDSGSRISRSGEAGALGLILHVVGFPDSDSQFSRRDRNCAAGKSAPSFAMIFHCTGTPLIVSRTRKSAMLSVMLIKRSRYRAAVCNLTWSGRGWPFTRFKYPNGAYFPSLNTHIRSCSGSYFCPGSRTISARTGRSATA